MHREQPMHPHELQPAWATRATRLAHAATIILSVCARRSLCGILLFFVRRILFRSLCKLLYLNPCTFLLWACGVHSGTHDTPDYIYEIVRACISSGQVVIRSLYYFTCCVSLLYVNKRGNWLNKPLLKLVDVTTFSCIFSIGCKK